MWTRANLKEMAKARLRDRYWVALGVTLIVMFLGGGSTAFSWRSSVNFKFDASDWNAFTNGDWQSFMEKFFSTPYFSGLFLTAAAIGLFAALFGLAFRFFVSTVVEVGGNRWFSRSRESDAVPMVSQVFSLFKGGSYMKTVGSMLWMNLFLFLWGLIAVIPMVFGWVMIGTGFAGMEIFGFRGDFLDFFNNGYAFLLPVIGMMIGVMGLASIACSIPVIIKTYSYRMTPWILADNPSIGYKRALRLSMDMTRGHKWNIFVLDLSFIGWMLLGILACCVGVFFVIPYIMATQAELYAALRQAAVDRSLCTMEELGYIQVK